MGGIGFTWEHPLHRFYKRAQWLDSFAGNAPAHRAALAKQLLDGARDVTDVDAFDVLAGRTGGLG
jgi:alkylation response protein AidB-like acyl-CoA dehydrogenase